MIVSIIVCIAKNNAIGLNNKLIYRLKDDLKRFKALTSGHTIIMGRRTFESLPNGALPLRRNIVLSSQNIPFPGAETFGSLEQALSACKGEDEVFIIGGEKVYCAALPLAKRLYLTCVDNIPEKADAFFPAFESESGWIEKERVSHVADSNNDKPFEFITLERQ